ncbi:MAG TPA: phosphoglucosamine mutase, partial [Thermoplasmata archaeon]|nr:phosphoglucosamine mutase [Thermoplasmata archaeon]
FGGEENGGLVFPGFQLARDGAMTAAATLDFLVRTSGTLADALADLPKYALVKEKVECPVALRDRVIETLGAAFTSEGGRIVTIDGLKVIRDDGWILLRPSGTEPLIRVFAEAKDRARAEALARDGLTRVRAAIAQLASR